MNEEFLNRLFSDYKPVTINIPFNEKEYKSGNGETIWAAVSNNDKEKYDNDCDNGTVEVMLLNNSVGFPSLMIGEKIMCEWRGKKIPVVPWNNIKDLEFDRVTVDVRKSQMKQLRGDHCSKCDCDCDCGGEIYIGHAQPFAD